MIDNIIEKIRIETGKSFIKIMLGFLRDKIEYHITLEEYYNYEFYKATNQKV